jgi:PQQ-like domain
MKTRIAGSFGVVLACIVILVPPMAVAGGAVPTVWTARYDGPAHRDDDAQSVAVSPDGGIVYVTGSSVGQGRDSDITTAAFDAQTATQIWSATYDGADDTDLAAGIAVAPAGDRVFVTGLSWVDDNLGFDYVTVAYDAVTGVQLWASRFDSDRGSDVPFAIGVSPDGGLVFVTGDIGHGWFGTIAYDADDGTMSWFDLAANGYQVTSASALGVSPDGKSVYVTGFRWNGQSDEIVTIAYEAASGHIRWISSYDSEDDDVALALAVSPAGDQVVIAGERRLDYPAGSDYLAVSYDADSGAEQWVAIHDSGSDTNDIAIDVGILPGPGGGVVVTGSVGAYFSGGRDIDTVSYDPATGAEQWSATYDGAVHGNDEGWALDVVSARGGVVVVAGQSAGQGTGPDLVMVAYLAQNGARAWVLRYDGPVSGTDIGLDVVASASTGRVFAAGTSDGPGTRNDYVIVSRMA